MVMAPMQVKRGGGGSAPADDMVMTPVAVPPTGAAHGDEMVMEPAIVPGGEGGSSAPTIVEPTAPQLTVVPATARAYRVGSLRVVFFTAGTDAGAPAYDGLVIERIR